jgi:KDO2-lipid IV(A) lauroyltransferase
VKPSSFYQDRFWKIGLAAARVLPEKLLHATARCVVALYYNSQKSRREIVRGNLLPAFSGDRALAAIAARKLFGNFAVKLADLWRYESGIDISSQIQANSDWARLEKLLEQKRGILLLTPHLGNWEFGAPLLAQKGMKLQVITQPEPQDAFTELRQKARARWGIETLVIRNDPFAFLEVIRKLQEGAVVALLVDRPPAPTAAQVQLFGADFQASIAPAELARATGCALLPVCLPRRNGKYVAELLPEIPYQRIELGNRAGRAALTQRIITVFEPIIREYIDQWYHFVPIWPQRESPENPSQSSSRSLA